MKLTLVFLLLIGAIFQNAQSLEVSIDPPAIQPPSLEMPSMYSNIVTVMKWREIANKVLDKMNDGTSWIEGYLDGVRAKINPPDLPSMSEATSYTETQITKTEEAITSAVTDVVD